MQQKYDSFLHNHTWDLVPLPPNCKVIGTNGCFGLKKIMMVMLINIKARLVSNVQTSFRG